jgi:hypothetical protein
MPGVRKAGLGLYNDVSPAHPPGISQRCDFSLHGAMGPPGPDRDRDGTSSADRSARLTALGISFRLGAARYRILPAGSRPAADEDRVGDKEARKLLEQAATLDQPGDADIVGGTPTSIATLVIELRRSVGPVVVMRLRPSAPTAKAPPLEVVAEASPPPSRRPREVKEGWIEVEVLDELGEVREGDSYRLKLTDGRILEGKVGSKGVIAVHGIDPGNVEVTITSLDGAAWTI